MNLLRLKLSRLGKILDSEIFPKKPSAMTFTQAPFPINIDGCTRIFFSTRSSKDVDGNYCSYIHFANYDIENRKIISFSETPLIKTGGRGTFDEHGTYPFSLINYKNGFLGYYGGWSRKISVPYEVKIGMVTSEDGKNFEKCGEGPVIGASLFEPMTLSGPRIFEFNELLHMFYISGTKWQRDSVGRPESIFKIRHATSIDGINWIRQNSNLLNSILEEDECQASPTVFYAHNYYHMLFSYKYGSDFRGTDRGYRLGYAVSENLYNWQRVDKMLSIDASAELWDNRDISYPCFYSYKDKNYIFYQGNDIGKSGFGYAKLTFVEE